MARYIAPVYVFQCRDCGYVFSRENAPGMGGPMCSECYAWACEIIARNYGDGRILDI